MDAARVAAIAARHRAADLHPAAAQAGEDSHEAERLRQQIDACWDALGIECLAFCNEYNEAFGAERLYCQPHADAIVVRSATDPQETVTFSRSASHSSHGARITAHRYSSHAAPVDLPLDGQVDAHRFTLTVDGQRMPASDAALVLLERFTDQLTATRPALD